ncbi:MAG TPA: ABC transporter permease, partial [Pyrinomonadaceae bacterium]|nr:ABC transporter permease [Pyrinomonadaceae bacterium]
MSGFWQDMKYGVRMLMKRRGFTAVAVLTLALGIGANSAIFSVVNSVLLRPLPYENPERLVRIGGRDARQQGDKPLTFSPADFFDWRAQNTVFEDLAAVDGWSPSLTGAGDPERIQAAKVSPSFFSILRARPAAGRAFLPEEEKRGNHYVVVLSDKLWQRRFGADPSIVGKQVELSGERFTVVGVMAREFEMPRFTGYDYEEPELWMPFAPDLSKWGRGGRSVDAAVGRLKPGVTVAQAQAEMDAITRRLEQQYPKSNSGQSVKVVSLYEQLVGAARPALLVFVAAVGLVLLIACANVANLLLARAASRHKEIAIRTALGAGRWRIVRQLLTESVLLSLAGGACGLLLALWGIGLVESLGARVTPMLAGVRVDYGVLAFTAAVSVLAGVAFGLAPALQVSTPDLNETLKAGARSEGGGRGGRLRSALVVAEMALALVLLAGAGLLVKSVVRLRAVDAGFDTSNLLKMSLALPSSRYKDGTVAPFFERLAQQIESLPGVEGAAFTSVLPLSSNFDGRSLAIEDNPVPRGQEVSVDLYVTTNGYLRAMQTELISGRDFEERDGREAPMVALVSETTARKLWPNQSPLGRRIKFPDSE